MDTKLPVPEPKLIQSLRSEAQRIRRTRYYAYRYLGLENGDLVSVGAIGYMKALERAETKGVTYVHSFALKAAVGAMLDFMDHEQEYLDHEVPAADMDSGCLSATQIAGMRKGPRGPSEGIMALPRWARRRAGRLSPSHQVTLRLHLRGYTPDEIADRLKVTRNAIHIRLHYIRKALGEGHTGKADDQSISPSISGN